MSGIGGAPQAVGYSRRDVPCGRHPTEIPDDTAVKPDPVLAFLCVFTHSLAG